MNFHVGVAKPWPNAKGTHADHGKASAAVSEGRIRTPAGGRIGEGRGGTSEEQVSDDLRLMDAGVPVGELCRKREISKQNLCP